MKTINKIHLLGYVGKDCTITHTAQGLEVAGLSLATSALKKSGEKVTQWHNCVAFGKTAELISQYAKKGYRVYVEGEMQYSEYEKEGVKMLSAKVVVNTVSFIDFDDSREQKQTAPAPKKAAYQAAQLDDSDIPF